MLDGVCRRTGDLFFCDLDGSGNADSSGGGSAAVGLISSSVVEATADCKGDL